MRIVRWIWSWGRLKASLARTLRRRKKKMKMKKNKIKWEMEWSDNMWERTRFFVVFFRHFIVNYTDDRARQTDREMSPTTKMRTKKFCRKRKKKILSKWQWENVNGIRNELIARRCAEPMICGKNSPLNSIVDKSVAAVNWLNSRFISVVIFSVATIFFSLSFSRLSAVSPFASCSSSSFSCPVFFCYVVAV